MMKNKLSKKMHFLTVPFLFLFAGCATIVSDTQKTIHIDTNQPHSQVTILNNGKPYKTLSTPATVSLPCGDGFFTSSSFTFRFEKEGYRSYQTCRDASLNGWYWGNIIFGGLLGILIVDPASGAMWKLDDTTVVGNLTPLKDYQSPKPIAKKTSPENPLPPAGPKWVAKPKTEPRIQQEITTVTVQPKPVAKGQSKIASTPIKKPAYSASKGNAALPPRVVTQQPAVRPDNPAPIQKKIAAKRPQSPVAKAPLPQTKSVPAKKSVEHPVAAPAQVMVAAPKPKLSDLKPCKDGDSISKHPTILNLKKLRDEKVITEEEYQSLLLKFLSTIN